jgi:hypothetical protein
MKRTPRTIENLTESEKIAVFSFARIATLAREKDLQFDCDLPSSSTDYAISICLGDQLEASGYRPEPEAVHRYLATMWQGAPYLEYIVDMILDEQTAKTPATNL